MDLLTFSPPELLKPYIKYTYLIETSGRGNLPKTFIPVVDGCPGIIVQDTNSGILFREGKKLPASFLFGQSTRISALTLEGEFNAMCVYLKPHALGSLFSLNAADLTDSCLDLAGLSSGNELIQKLDDATSRKEKVDLLSTYLIKTVDRGSHRCDPVIHYVIEKIMSSKGGCSLKRLQVEVHLSERSFERKFKRQVGISAKLFSRICRFQSSFRQLGNADFNNLCDIAFENDYADQSHFIRAFKEFAGSSPLQYQRNAIQRAENLSEVLV